MSSTGVLIILVALFLLFNADKLAWVFTGQLKLNTASPQKSNNRIPPDYGGKPIPEP